MPKLVHLLGTSVLILLSATAQDKRPVTPKGSPAGSPFSPAILAGGTLYVSGQVGRDPKTNAPPAEFEAEVAQCIQNIEAIMGEAGMSLKDAVAVQVYLTDMELFPRMNAVYTKHFPEPRPARTTVGVAKLVGTYRIEVTVTAYKSPGGTGARTGGGR